VTGEQPRVPGIGMRQDMTEQPGVFARLMEEGTRSIGEVARVIASRRPRFVLLAARGTSDHAALYAKYLIEIHLGLPAGLVSMSTTTVYGARPDLRDVLYLAVSQSGGSPDLVASLAAAREAGALTVAVTNNAGSALAKAAELHVDVLAGHERAVAATKTYTAELLALYLLIEGVRGNDASGAKGLADAAAEVLERTGPVAAAAARYRFANRLVTTGRGYAYPTAHEAALKLMETSYLSAQAFSAADLLHGPMAMVDATIPVVAVVPDGPGGAAMGPVLDRVRELRGDLLVVGPAVDDGHPRLAVPRLPEELSPMVEIIPLQWLAYELALARGDDPDAPRGLRKVTETW
jgi:glucosamine--fructose-6-phosphate aminotransferase (isomerizing)